MVQRRRFEKILGEKNRWFELIVKAIGLPQHLFPSFAGRIMYIKHYLGLILFIYFNAFHEEMDKSICNFLAG